MDIKSPTTATHIVLKISDCQKYLNQKDLGELYVILDKVGHGRVKDGKKINEYLVVNTDEPYALSIKQSIDLGEKIKYSIQHQKEIEKE